MRQYGKIGLLTVMSMASLGMGVSIGAGHEDNRRYAIIDSPEVVSAAKVERRRVSRNGYVYSPYRSKNKPDKRPKLKGNRNHTSKRVRRKHRRAA